MPFTITWMPRETPMRRPMDQLSTPLRAPFYADKAVRLSASVNAVHCHGGSRNLAQHWAEKALTHDRNMAATITRWPRHCG